MLRSPGPSAIPLVARALALALSLALSAALGLAAPGRAQAPEVVELRFDGARAFAHSELAAAIVTTATRCPNLLYELVCWAGVGRESAYLEPRELESDVLRLRVYYHERGYRAATVRADTIHTGRGVRVVFQIDEGQPVRVAELHVDGSPDGLPSGPLPLRPGAPFDMVAYETGRDTLLARLRNNGFARAQVLLGYQIRHDRPLDALVRYELVPGVRARFGEVQVIGNREASSDLVRRMLTFDEGATYDRSALLESQRNLYGLQIFRHAEIQPDLAAEPDSLVPIAVQVAEGYMQRVRVGGGISNAECGNVDGRWVGRNFMGNGRRLELRGKVGNLLMDQCQQLPLLSTDYAPYDRLTGLAAVDFTQPWLFGPRNSLGVGMFVERRTVPEVFVRTATGGHLSVGRAVGQYSALTLAFRPEWTRLTTDGDLFFCVNFIACTYEDTRVLREPHWLAPVTLTFSTDRTDRSFAPSGGFIVRGDLEHAGRYTGSDFAYTRLIGEGASYAGRGGGVVLATRVRGGVVWPHGGSSGTDALRVNPQKRFFAGGPNSVRGFDQYRLGPSVLGIDAVPWLIEGGNATGGRVERAGCTVATINDGSCDVSMLSDAMFHRRPVGGEVLLEGNIELRFPLPVAGGRLRGAAFLDAGQVWLNTGVVALRDLVATPGVGIRYFSPVGPIRFDAGFDTRGPEQLNVLTTRVEECLFTGIGDCRKIDGPPRQTLRNTGDIVTLDRPVVYGERVGDIDSWGDFFGRFRLHFSIGQAF
jgi:outer membrane protein assembly factor BamA